MEDFHRHADLTGDLVATSALVAMSYHWALEQHAKGGFVPLNFMVEKYTPTYAKIKAILHSISNTQSFVLFIHNVVQCGQSLLGTSTNDL